MLLLRKVPRVDHVLMLLMGVRVEVNRRLGLCLGLGLRNRLLLLLAGLGKELGLHAWSSIH